MTAGGTARARILTRAESRAMRAEDRRLLAFAAAAALAHLPLALDAGERKALRAAIERAKR